LDQAHRQRHGRQRRWFQFPRSSRSPGPRSLSSESTAAYKSQRWNDGDSFHVILLDQKELIFRLYFVDAPEEERVYADRIVEQAAYFGISAYAAVEIGREASEFTKLTLAKPFTIYTRWRRALGRSALWRYYAIVVTTEGKDLNELLVSAGLARICGTRTPCRMAAIRANTSRICANWNQKQRLRSQPPLNGRISMTVTLCWKGLLILAIMPSMKYWEIIADKLSAAGWSWGYRSAVTRQAGGGLLKPVPNA